MRQSTMLKIGMTVATLAVAAAFAATALGSSSTSVSSASNASLREHILAGPSGHTLYALSPETSSHLLCKSSECLKFWPPLKASSAGKVKLGAGVHGKVGILHRSNGISQVTLNGHPLYYFSGDSGRDEVNGQSLKGFGGTWHVLSASGQPSSKAPAASGAPTSTTPTNTTSTPSNPGYEY
jgi:predicted lipoprotein with Yx(FWY)xxD motif